ncbi:MAG: Gfo/Idh/MocA family oxidoreductase [Proteobacteria bacterium]|nr:Gfo/Idh/MocA family oxidoreductase [Pseudomonadota bacterium]
MLQGMLDVGCEAAAWWTDGEPVPAAGFKERFASMPRVVDRRAILEDRTIDLVLIASVPSARAALAIEAMSHGKDVMVDKPGCVSIVQLEALRRCVAATGRIWSVNFSERFEVPAVTKADELVAAGAIGRVVQTVGLGPHRHNAHLRPPWFYERAQTGGILCDIGSHQIDQFLFFTGSSTAEIVSAASENYANPAHPDFEDFGEILLKSGHARGYIRVDWYTPEALPTWGDGRLVLLGTEGTIELRKYVDVGGAPGTDHLLLVNGSRCERIDTSRAGTPYFGRLADDVRARTQTAMAQSHAFVVTELALSAQKFAQAGEAGDRT